MNSKMLVKGFQKPKKIIYEKDSCSSTYGRFIIYPLERGFGHTLANTFRRLLLSSIPGYAISAMKVTTRDENGNPRSLSSSFESIPEVTEETSMIINNLKNVKLRLTDDLESKTIKVERKGYCEVKAGDLAIDDTIEVLNPDYPLFTLSDKGDVTLELQIDLSRGYVDAERQEEYIETIDTIPIDAMFSPIEKVKYEVVNTRVGQRNDYEKIIFELWTDGTTKPEDALAGAAKILKEHLQVFINFEEEEDSVDMAIDREDDSKKSLFETPVDELELSVRASNCLRTVNIRTIGDLVSKTEDYISGIKHFGKKSLLEIKEKLNKQKLSFGMEDEVSKIINKKK